MPNVQQSLGWSKQSKGRWKMSGFCTALGICLNLRDAKLGVVFLQNTEKRAAELVETIKRTLAEGRLRRHDSERLRGRLQICSWTGLTWRQEESQTAGCRGAIDGLPRSYRGGCSPDLGQRFRQLLQGVTRAIKRLKFGVDFNLKFEWPKCRTACIYRTCHLPECIDLQCLIQPGPGRGRATEQAVFDPLLQPAGLAMDQFAE